jgi:hypothetical protein
VLKPDPEQILDELKKFCGGVADTSTLIYLERINLLPLVSKYFQLLVAPDVVREFGRTPAGCIVCGEICVEGADQAVLQLATKFRLPALSEDRRLLMSSHRHGVKYYNTLMILLALLLQQKLSLAEYQRAYSCLREIARYSPAVWQVGEQVFLNRSLDV